MSKQTIASQLDLAGFSPDHVSADGVSYFRGKEGDGYEISKIEILATLEGEE